MRWKHDSLVGKMIEIIYMEGEPQYSGRIGKITYEDDKGLLHGGWGDLAIIPEKDDFRIL